LPSTERKIFWGLKNQLDHCRITAAQFLGNPEKMLGFKSLQLLVIHVFHRFAHRSVDTWLCITRTVFGAFAGKLENKAVFNLKKCLGDRPALCPLASSCGREIVLRLTS
jgi:hypothetical protein